MPSYENRHLKKSKIYTSYQDLTDLTIIAVIIDLRRTSLEFSGFPSDLKRCCQFNFPKTSDLQISLQGSYLRHTS
jgi:hypothetical protein